MASIFSKIISGEIPAYKVAEDDHFLAFLDIFPIVEGHVLVIPKIENDYVFDLSDEVYTQLFLFAKKVALAMEEVIECKRIGIAVIGLEVPHTHIHLVPLETVGDINFEKPKLQLSKEKMNSIAGKIKQAWEAKQ